MYVNAPPGLFFPGDPGIPKTFTSNRPWDFQPRAGIAWDPNGNGKQVIRALGTVCFTTRWPPLTGKTRPAMLPGERRSILFNPAGGFTNPYAGYPGGNPFPSPNPPSKNQAFPSAASYYTYPIHGHPTYTNQWNLSYEAQPFKDWVFSAAYVGNKTTHIWTGEDVDPGVYIPGTCGGAPCSTTSNTNQRRVLYLQNPYRRSFLFEHLAGGRRR